MTHQAFSGIQGGWEDLSETAERGLTFTVCSLAGHVILKTEESRELPDSDDDVAQRSPKYVRSWDKLKFCNEDDIVLRPDDFPPILGRTLGFHWDRWVIKGSDRNITYRELSVPHCWLALTLGIWPLVAGARYIRIKRRRIPAAAMTLCPKCGYDLRATPELCPECGYKPPAISNQSNKITPLS